MADDLRVGLVIRAVDQASSVMQQIRRNFHSAFSQMADGAEKASKIWQKAGDIRNAAEGLKSVQMGLTGSVKDSINAYGKFETAMTEVKVLGNLTTGEMADLEAQMMQIGTTTTVGPTEAAHGLIELTKAGYTTTDAMSALKDTIRLAQSESISMGQASEIVSDTLHSFGLGADYAGMAANALASAANRSTTDVAGIAEAMKYAAPSAHAFNLSLEDTSAIIAGLASRGLKGSMGGTGIDAMLRGFLGTSRIARVELKKLRVDGEKFRLFDIIEGPDGKKRKQSRDVFALLTDLRKATEGMGSYEKGFALEKIFGEQGKRSVENILSLMESANGEMSEMEKLRKGIGIDQNRDIIGSKSATKLETYEGAVARFDAAWKSLQISMGRVGEAMTPLISRAADLVGWFAKFTEEHPVLTGSIMGLVGALGLAAGALALVAQGFVFFLGVKGFSAFVSGMGQSATAATGLGTASTGAAVGVGTLGGALKSMLVTLGAVYVIVESVSMVFEEVKKHWDDLSSMTKWAEGFSGMWDSFKEHGQSNYGGMPVFNPLAGAAGVAGELFDPTAYAEERMTPEERARRHADPKSFAEKRYEMGGILKIEVEDNRVRVTPKYSTAGQKWDISNGTNMGGP